MGKVWFDAHNIDHCKAYRHLQKTGAWPEGFELLDTEYFNAGVWQVAIMGNLANAWIDQVLEYGDYTEINKEDAELFESSKD